LAAKNEDFQKIIFYFYLKVYTVRHIIIFLFITSKLLFPYSANAETIYPSQLDSLLHLVKDCETDSGKVFLYIQAGELFRGNNSDSAKLFYQKALDLSQQINLASGKIRSINYMGILNMNAGNYEAALKDFNQALEISKKSGNTYGESICYQNIGLVHNGLDNLERTRFYFHKAYNLREAINDTAGMANCCVGIGISFHSDSGEMGDSALFYYEKAIQLSKIVKDLNTIASCYTNMGHIYRAKGDLKKGLNAYFKAYELELELGGNSGISASLISIAQAYLDMKNYKMVEKYVFEGIEYAQKAGRKDFEKNGYITLYVLYKETQNYELSLKYYELYSEAINELYDIEKNRQIEEMEAKYELASHQHQIELQNAELKEQKASIAKKRLQNIILFTSLFAFLIIVIIIYRNYKIKKNLVTTLEVQKNEIHEINEELNQQNEEISAQRDQIYEQHQIVNDQKNKIEEIYSYVDESIEYATRIQRSILPDIALLKQHVSDCFVLYKPKDKVSGDFYWWAHIENHTIITAADSTGHGVPGAFMSMLGSSFLREIVQKEYITHTGVILRKLRKEIVKALKQKGVMGEQKDGMDMAIISINHDTKVVQYSGANNPIYILTKDERALPGYESLTGFAGFYEIKPDKMPIAIYDKMDAFQTHEIPLQTGDQLFMFSDGYADQFGGPKGKKFKYKPFKRLLSDHKNEAMHEQKVALEQAFETWKGTLDQIDDVVVVGIKI
jgi:serine phosphatase RsbU (regulator of sigma subunit)